MNKLTIVLLLTLVVSCTPETNTAYKTIDGFAEGTTYHIVYQDPKGRDLKVDFTAFFEKFDKSLSIYDSTSIVSRINAGDTLVELDKWFVECLKISQDIGRRTDGLLDITLRPLIAAYGFGGKDAVEDISQHQIDSLLEFVGYNKVSVRDGRISKVDSRIELDFNAIAKGYSVDMLGEMMDSMGIKNYLVEVGGEIFSRGKNPNNSDWTVAIDTPYEGNYMPGTDTQAVMSLSGNGLATSGNYRKFKVDQHGQKVVHTVDPRTGKPSIHNLLSATIVAPTCAIADGFATACMVAGLEGAKKIINDNTDLEAMLIYSVADTMKIYSTAKMEQRILRIKD